MISVITPTADQPQGIALLERWIARQTVQPDEWIVADDGDKSAALTMGQTHIRRERVANGGRSLGGNLLAALEAARGGTILVMEHDDWYAPTHIETQIIREGYAVGCGNARYYHVGRRSYLELQARGASLCNTLVRCKGIDALKRAAEYAAATGEISVDRRLWRGIDCATVHTVDTVVGIKGLPGRCGLGMGHQARGFHPDPTLEKLTEWVGDDAAIYAGLH